MQALNKLTGIAVPIDGDNIDTDRLIPARLMRNPRDQDNDYSKFLFHDLRFNDDGSEISDIALNIKPRRKVQIIVSDSNFGCGSSRESAVYALVDYGIRVVIATSFGDIFYANCVRNGVAPLILTQADCASLRQWLKNSGDSLITVDLGSREIKVVPPQSSADTAASLSFSFQIPDFQRNCLMQGMDEVELTLERQDAITAFEDRYLQQHPWLNTVAQS